MSELGSEFGSETAAPSDSLTTSEETQNQRRLVSLIHRKCEIIDFFKVLSFRDNLLGMVDN